MATITAKFSGQCRACGGSFSAGTEIIWAKGEGSRHVACPTAPVASEPVAPVVTGPAPYVVWERWDALSTAGHRAREAAVIGQTRRYELLPEVSRRGTPISEEDRRRHLPKVRPEYADRGSSNGGTSAPPAEPGVYVIVATANWRYQNAEDNEDMGDRQGANWSGALYLRRATEEEAAKDAADRWEAARPAREHALAVEREAHLEREGRAAFVAATESTVTEEMRAAFVPPSWMGSAPTPEQVSLALGAPGLGSTWDVYLTPEELAERKATMVDLWVGREFKHGAWMLSGSYVRAWAWRGQIVIEEHTYIYDWDQPIRGAGCAELNAHVRAVDEARRVRQEAERVEREAKYKAEREAAEAERVEAARVAEEERQRVLASTIEVADFRGEKLGISRRIPVEEASVAWKPGHVIVEVDSRVELLSVGAELGGGKVVARRVVGSFSSQGVHGYDRGSARRMQYLVKPRAVRRARAAAAEKTAE